MAAFVLFAAYFYVAEDAEVHWAINLHQWAGPLPDASVCFEWPFAWFRCRSHALQCVASPSCTAGALADWALKGNVYFEAGGYRGDISLHNERTVRMRACPSRAVLSCLRAADGVFSVVLR